MKDLPRIKCKEGEAVLLKEIKIPALLNHLGIETVDSFVDTAYNGKLLQLRISTFDYFDYNSEQDGNAIDLIMYLKDLDRTKAKIELIKFLDESGFDFMNTLRPEIKSVHKHPFINSRLDLLEGELNTYFKEILIQWSANGLDYEDAEDIARMSAETERLEILSKVYCDFTDFLEREGFSNEVAEYLFGKNGKLNRHAVKDENIYCIKDHRKAVEYLTGTFSKHELYVSGLFNPDGTFVLEHHPILFQFFDADFSTLLRGQYLCNGSDVPPENVPKYAMPLNNSGRISDLFYKVGDISEIKFGKKKDKLLIVPEELDCFIAKQMFYDSIALIGNATASGVEQGYEFWHELNYWELVVIVGQSDYGRKCLEHALRTIRRSFTLVNLPNHQDLTHWYHPSKNLFYSNDVEITKVERFWKGKRPKKKRRERY